MNIGFSLSYSRQFLPVTNSSFAMIQASLLSPSGRRYIREMQARHQHIFAWTVNDDKVIDWCIGQGVDGIITDDVPKALKLCETYQGKSRYSWSWKMGWGFLKLNFWLYLWGVVFRKRYGTCIDMPVKRHDS